MHCCSPCCGSPSTKPSREVGFCSGFFIRANQLEASDVRLLLPSWPSRLPDGRVPGLPVAGKTLLEIGRRIVSIHWQQPTVATYAEGHS